MPPNWRSANKHATNNIGSAEGAQPHLSWGRRSNPKPYGTLKDLPGFGSFLGPVCAQSLDLIQSMAGLNSRPFTAVKPHTSTGPQGFCLGCPDGRKGPSGGTTTLRIPKRQPYSFSSIMDNLALQGSKRKMPKDLKVTCDQFVGPE